MKKGLIFWFTGLSGSGKTTIAKEARKALIKKALSVLILDGDDVRERLHKNLSFTEKDIKENNKLITQLCSEKRAAYDIILVPIISPYRMSRQYARQTLERRFYEIYFSANLETVVKRDTKGLYAKAKDKVIDNLVGYSPGNVYEPPENPDYEINTALGTIEEQSRAFVDFILDKFNSEKI